ncbi:MAG: SRPBCC family protein [Anaerolineales bacterium]|nr:SRPBCC family protein [Anaerolineales bacterium]
MKTRVSSSVYIDRSPEEVERIILDPSKTVLWTSDLEKFEVISGEPGFAGSRAKLHYLEGGRRYVMEDHLVEVDPGRRYLSHVSGAAIDASVETLLEPEGAGTVVRIHWTGRGKPLLLRLVLPFIRGNISRQAQKDLVKLKELVESGQRVE